MITIEQIEGRPYTVISYMPTSIVRLYFSSFLKSVNGVMEMYFDDRHYATALPPLPRNPKPDDAWLLHLYLSMGIIPVFGEERLDRGIVNTYCNGANRITSTIFNGEKVDVALTDE